MGGSPYATDRKTGIESPSPGPFTLTVSESSEKAGLFVVCFSRAGEYFAINRVEFTRPREHGRGENEADLGSGKASESS